ncbi:hypothetical protein H9P43_005681 [Blastocladiella emersonii ATCC 22665]|nr:hypothetical protein H9P43_005681 [Blastocladiella emersonii ATCC 22665]
MTSSGPPRPKVKYGKRAAKSPLTAYKAQQKALASSSEFRRKLAEDENRQALRSQQPIEPSGRAGAALSQRWADGLPDSSASSLNSRPSSSASSHHETLISVLSGSSFQPMLKLPQAAVVVPPLFPTAARSVGGSRRTSLGSAKATATPKRRNASEMPPPEPAVTNTPRLRPASKLRPPTPLPARKPPAALASSASASPAPAAAAAAVVPSANRAAPATPRVASVLSPTRRMSNVFTPIRATPSQAPTQTSRVSDPTRIPRVVVPATPAAPAATRATPIATPTNLPPPRAAAPPVAVTPAAQLAPEFTHSPDPSPEEEEEVVPMLARSPILLSSPNAPASHRSRASNASTRSRLSISHLPESPASPPSTEDAPVPQSPPVRPAAEPPAAHEPVSLNDEMDVDSVMAVTLDLPRPPSPAPVPMPAPAPPSPLPPSPSSRTSDAMDVDAAATSPARAPSPLPARAPTPELAPESPLRRSLSPPTPVRAPSLLPVREQMPEPEPEPPSPRPPSPPTSSSFAPTSPPAVAALSPPVVSATPAPASPPPAVPVAVESPPPAAPIATEPSKPAAPSPEGRLTRSRVRRRSPDPPLSASALAATKLAPATDENRPRARRRTRIVVEIELTPSPMRNHLLSRRSAQTPATPSGGAGPAPLSATPVPAAATKKSSPELAEATTKQQQQQQQQQEQHRVPVVRVPPALPPPPSLIMSLPDILTPVAPLTPPAAPRRPGERVVIDVDSSPETSSDSERIERRLSQVTLGRSRSPPPSPQFLSPAAPPLLDHDDPISRAAAADPSLATLLAQCTSRSRTFAGLFADSQWSFVTTRVAKIGEASYSDVFLVGGTTVVKVMPFAVAHDPFAPAPAPAPNEIAPPARTLRRLTLRRTSRAAGPSAVPAPASDGEFGDDRTATDLAAEIRLALAAGALPGFIRTTAVHVVHDTYPPPFLAAWHAFRSTDPADALNPPPSAAPRWYCVVQMPHGGTSVERARLPAPALLPVLRQVAGALARAEQEIEFEHRDLHWGNVLVRHGARSRRPADVVATVIDFTLSRATINGDRVASVIPDDVFDNTDHPAGSDDADQFDKYREMRAAIVEQERNEVAAAAGNKKPRGRPPIRPRDWSVYCPSTNALWLAHFARRLCSKAKDGDQDARVVELLDALADDMAECESAAEVVQVMAQHGAA